MGTTGGGGDECRCAVGGWDVTRRLGGVGRRRRGGRGGRGGGGGSGGRRVGRG